MHTLGTHHSPRGRRRTAVLGAASAVLSTALVASAVGPADAAPARGESDRFTQVKIVTKTVENEKYSADVVEREDNTMNAGQTEVVRPGRPGVRDVTYRFRLENGKVVSKKVLDQSVERKPRPKIVKVGTKEPYGVWDRLAGCESGGNWHINTGNGYYGGLQFALGTWRAYGGTGLPSDHSRETQIAVAIKLRNASGGYGPWPGCAAKLGLPT